MITALSSCAESVVNLGSNFSFSSSARPDTLDARTIDTLIIDSAKILIKDIKLNGSGSADTAFFAGGPYVLNLKPDSSVNVVSVGVLTAGLYDKVKFEIHKPAPNEVPPDPEFADSNGTYSAIVKGKFNGTTFIYRSKKSAHQIVSLGGTVFIVYEFGTNVTLLVKPYRWFLENGNYLNPLDSANENDIDNNIKDSFKAFKDNDGNGIPD